MMDKDGQESMGYIVQVSFEASHLNDLLNIALTQMDHISLYTQHEPIKSHFILRLILKDSRIGSYIRNRFSFFF